MKFKTSKNIDGKVVYVFTNYIKPSNHMGNITRANKKAFGDNAFFFFACGKELMFTAKELRKIADKMDAVKRQV